MLVTLLLRDSDAIGAIGIRRTKVQPFTPKQVALLKTFANQAAIAIENARLFTELQEKNSALTAAHAQVTEALEQQTATSEILRVISSSPTNTQPVFDTIAANAARLCAARDAQVLRVGGEVLRLVSAHGSPSMPEVRSISRGHAVGRAVIDRQTIHVHDMTRAVTEFPETSALQHGVASILAVPLLRRDVSGRRDQNQPNADPTVRGRRDRTPADLRRPGRHRHRERAAVHRASSQQP
jgi:GAF domain-containing protein